MTNIPGPKDEADNPRKEKHVGLIVALLTLLVLVPLGFRLYSSYLAKRMLYYEKVAEKKRLQQELDRMEKENKRLVEHKQYLNTKQGVEKIARDRLGLTKPGEITFIVIPKTPEDENSPEPVKNKKSDNNGVDKKPDKPGEPGMRQE